MNRRGLSLLVTALSVAFIGNAVAQSHDHSHHQHHDTPPQPEPKRAADTHDHPAHAAHAAHDHGTPAEHDHSSHSGNDQAHHQPSGPTLPPITDADRAAAFPDLGHMSMADHGMDDDAIHFKALFDGLEWRHARHGGSDSFAWNATTWIGRDINKLWLKTSGERRAGHTHAAHVEALWGHAIGPWWDTVIGIRHDSLPGPSQTRAAFGMQGLAPYQFEIDAMLYVGGDSKAELHVEAEYELLFTWRWILVPSLGTGWIASDDVRRDLQSGWSGIEAGLTLRYEIRPDLAPYIGHVWHGGGSANQHDRGGQWIAGMRFWF
ncbi:copper resistance protein B [Xanthomonadaceae bacterium XH05]|nr:copper resistance protein B [Xanthomonadaceae bacterium XH05]